MTSWWWSGGIIPDADVPRLNEIGIRGIFQPGTPMQDIVDFIAQNARSVSYSERTLVTHKLLLADDSVTIQRVVELTFSGEDVQVVTVGDGEQAIARIPIELPDIVLADIGMPKRSGYDVAAFVKGRADLSHIPVLLLAGAFEPVDENRAQQVRSDGVLVKPFEPQQVISRVRAPHRELAVDVARTAYRSSETSGRGASGAKRREGRRALSRPRDGAGRQSGGSRISRSECRPNWTTTSIGSMRRLPSSGPTGIAGRARPASVDDEYDGRDVPTLESLLAVSASAQPDDHPLGRAAVPVELSAVSTRPAARGRSAFRECAQGVGGTRGRTKPRGRHVRRAVCRGAGRNGCASRDPFQHRARTPAVTITDNLVDEVTRRVVERLAPEAANELVAQIVSEVAERLIREEITRIKAAAAARL